MTDEQIRPCAGTCGRDTRPVAMPASQAPNTVRRTRGDYCGPCVAELNPPVARNDRTDPAYQASQLWECAGTCGRLTRPKWLAEHLAKGTVRRVDAEGRCAACSKGVPPVKKAILAVDHIPAPAYTAPTAPAAFEPEHPINLDVPAAHGLSGFLQRSRERRRQNMRATLHSASGTGRPPQRKVYA